MKFTTNFFSLDTSSSVEKGRVLGDEINKFTILFSSFISTSEGDLRFSIFFVCFPLIFKMYSTVDFNFLIYKLFRSLFVTSFLPLFLKIHILCR